MPAESPPKTRNRAPSKPIEITSEAQRELLAIRPKLALSTIAAAGSVSKMQASRWTRGDDRPGFLTRAALEAAFGIPAYLWNYAPAASEAHRLALHGLSFEELNPELHEQMKVTAPGHMPLARVIARRAELGDPDPSPLDGKAALRVAPQPPASSVPAPAPRPSKGPPTHPWQLATSRREVARLGYSAALREWMARSGSVFEDEFLPPEDRQ
ncbi:MAG: hypothetical protein WDO74_23465 [Pseudomonadota bacterium]